jgi:murein L,D-transpeptidase YafK
MQNKLLLFTIIFTSFINLSLFANDITTQYRINGIENIEKQLDKDLADTQYWREYLKDKETRFGYIEVYSDILVCDKSKSTLSLYRKDLNNSFTLTKEYNAFTGKIKGDKYEEGDLRTPVGIYDITKKISKLDSFYGPMAFVTSYPNIYDKYKGKNGSGIWIHGLPTEQERDEFTKGCIAINNQSIECLDKNIDISKTLLIINETEVVQNVSKETLSGILAQLYAWRYAWLYNKTEDYLNFYSETFVRFDGMNKKAFTKYKTRIFNKKESKTILFNNINVLPYPNLKETYEISFKEIYKSESFAFTGDKVLVVEFSNNSMKILTEK